MQHNYKRILPNLFTFASVFLGFYSIILAANGQMAAAAWSIIFAAVMDAMDGIMARLTKTSSNFGVELDSLADVVSFGAAPSFLLYCFRFPDAGILQVFIASIFLMGGAFRLARFNANLTGFDKSSFTGLPIPAAAITLVSAILSLTMEPLFSEILYEYLPVLAILLAVLMISRIKYDTLPRFSTDSVKEKPLIFIFLFIAVVVAIFTKGESIFYFFILIVFSGIFKSAYYQLLPDKNKSGSIQG